MAVAAYSLVDLDELRVAFKLAGTAQDSALEDVAHAVTDHVEDYLGRLLITRGAITEYHTPRWGSSELMPLEWPTIAITSVGESLDSPRDYTGDNLLTAGTDYQLVVRPKLRTILRRVSSDVPCSWASGLRAVKLVYTAGYASRTTLPPSLRSLALRYAAKLWAEKDIRTSLSNATGSINFGPPTFDPQMLLELDPWKRQEWTETGERAA